MWTYKQSTGELFRPGGDLAGHGWAGQGAGRNNPKMQNVHNIGPLPEGMYKIEKPAYTHPHLGPVVMNLTPAPENQMFGRGSFRIHGAAVVHPELSSEGCMIQQRLVREEVEASEDDDLQVIA